MPVKLIVALAFLALASVMQVMHITEGNYTIPNYVNLALKLFLVIGLVRGSEGARTLALVAIVIGGLMFMFGEGGAKRQISGIVFGGGLALFAAQFLTWLF